MARTISAETTRFEFGEFMLVGGATLLLLPLSWLVRGSFGLSTPELVVGFTAFYGAHWVNDPHFAATYLLFYERGRKRAFGDEFQALQKLRYWLAGAVAPLALGVWMVWAIASDSAAALGAMMELMFLLVGWHYVKQGFGVFSVLCARRGLALQAQERRWLLFHGLSGWLFAWVNPSKSSIEIFEKGVVYWALPRPPLLEQVALGIFGFSTLGLLWTALNMWRSRRRPPLAASCGYLVSIWLWLVFSAADPLLIYVIPALHSLQYLYFVHLMQKNRALEAEGPPLFGPAAGAKLAKFAVAALALGWLLFHGLPSALDEVAVPTGRTLVGATPYFAGLFALVNIHHYLMDAVIWRRENPETGYLRRKPLPVT